MLRTVIRRLLKSDAEIVLTLCYVMSNFGMVTGAIYFGELKGMHSIEGIAVTGKAMPEDVERCMAAGFKSHILKPFHYERLLKSSLKHWMGKCFTPRTAEMKVRAASHEWRWLAHTGHVWST